MLFPNQIIIDTYTQFLKERNLIKMLSHILENFLVYNVSLCNRV